MKFNSIVCAGLLAASLSAVAPIAARAAEPRAAHAPRKAATFFLKDNDRVVFYGDSITDQRQYTTYIESYCVTRFPKKNLTFVHSGWGGDRVTGGGGGPIDLRLQRDVLPYKPTVVTICLGMNDGSYKAFDQNIFNTYVSGYRHIIETLQKELPGVRLTLITASAYDDVTKTPGFAGGYNSTLVAYGEAVRELGHEYNIPVADTNAPLVAALSRANTVNPAVASKIMPDRVHPQHGGHLIMAAAVLKAWNAPATVADIEINAQNGQVTRAENTKVSSVSTSGDTLAFTEQDIALPWPLDRDPERDQDTQLSLGVTEIEQDLNRYMLKVTGLKSARYQMSVDGKALGTFASGDLANGIDLAAITALPSNEQARLVLGVTRKHNDLHFRKWREIQLGNKRKGIDDVPADARTQMDALDAQEVDAVKEQRALAQPRPHRVELKPEA